MHARAYSEHGTHSEFARSDVDISCSDAALHCLWRNVDYDELDWVLGEGQVDHTKFNLITGSLITPGKNSNCNKLIRIFQRNFVSNISF